MTTGLAFTTATLPAMSPLGVHELYKLRVDVFVHEQQCAYAEIDDIDPLPSTVHVLAHDNGVLVGCARVFPDSVQHFHDKCEGSVDVGEEREMIQLGRLCTALSHRGSGLGADLIRASFDYCAKNFPGQDIVITAQVPLKSYYESFGFEACGEIFDWDGMDHLPMIKYVNKAEA